MGASLILLLRTPTNSYPAEVAAKADLSTADRRVQLLAEAAAALLVLVAAPAVSVCKPWGRIGKWRLQLREPAQQVAAGRAAASPTP
ncbi:hypothetical protein [Hymenobacter algoricola]|uniref:hypothetical protein n=1 Tax=Hymenobacter algoricola TaxID=486267 RepID=UPI0031F03CA6